MEFLFLDRQVAAAVKPAGIPTQESEGHADHFTRQVIEAIKMKEGREKVYLHPIHRLDTPTSGIVLFARTSKSLSRLQEALRQKKLKKEYVAEIEGHLKQRQGKLEHYLFHASHRSEVVAKETPEAKLATLTYEVMEKRDATTLVYVYLDTGRYHQIRAQFAHIGHPLVGDSKYGSTIPSDRIHLHHTRLIFPHPIENKSYTVESLPPF